MCIVSMVHDWGQKQPWQDWQPAVRRDKWEEFKELIRKAEEIDRVTGQPDCVDPKKLEFLKEVQKLIDKT